MCLRRSATQTSRKLLRLCFVSFYAICLHIIHIVLLFPEEIKKRQRERARLGEKVDGKVGGTVVMLKKNNVKEPFACFECNIFLFIYRYAN